MVWSTYGGGVYFISIYTCCAYILERIKLRLNFYCDYLDYDSVPYEGYVCTPQCKCMIKVYGYCEVQWLITMLGVSVLTLH